MLDKSKPKHSYTAIVPNYNDSRKIGESLHSLKNQTLPLAEIIVVDDGSTDDSVAVINKLIADMPNAKLIHNPQNLGVVGALNRGINEATGDYLFLCSANDTYHPQMVEWCEDMLAPEIEVGMVSGNAAAWDERKGMAGYDRVLPLPQQAAFYPPAEVLRAHRRASIQFNGGANALKRDLVVQFGGLHPELRWHCDWMLYQWIALKAGMAYVPRPFSTIRLEGGKSYSSNYLDWSKEKPVLTKIIQTLRNYPKEAPLFRRAALLPMYWMKEPLFLLSAELRWYITPLLLWRVTIYFIGYWVRFIIPRPWLMEGKRIFRI